MGERRRKGKRGKAKAITLIQLKWKGGKKSLKLLMEKEMTSWFLLLLVKNETGYFKPNGLKNLYSIIFCPHTKTNDDKKYFS